ncbi:restriction endonuclease subunit S [Streptococcus sanguinis]|uniref:restriction endonuclease subunit S n=1 Tax=Streptococcus TaxID=1301 RepID=UPI000517CB4C|nr:MULTISPECIES: restriction endonuclease subunit S [Streptococcus]MBZ2075859.1 restriction endonuclease subunit S [Streptococcus sanguinis]MDN5013391.1 restriction endonuclease subunit S [Streptococcus sp. SN3]SQG30945.1 putative HsdS [Streptococcus sanguinis]
MSEWKEYTIGEICSRFSSGKSIKASQISAEGLYPVYGGNGLRGFTDTFNFDGECSIIGRQGAYCGNVRYFKGKAFMTEHAIVAVVNENHNNGYVSNLLSMMNLAQYQGQSAQPGLSVSTLSKIIIKLPDLATQEQCFNVLNLIDQKIQINNQINRELEDMAKTLYDYWFVQFDFPDQNGKPYKSSGGKMVYNPELKREIPEGWRVEKLGDVAKFKNGINYEKTSSGSEKIKIINVRNISSSTIFVNQTDLDEISLENDKSTNFIVNEGMILITRSGIPGATRLVSELEAKTVYSGFIIASEVNDLIFKNLIFYYLKNVEEVLKNQSAGTIMKNISQSVLTDMVISLPPQNVLLKFNSIIDNLLEQMKNVQRQNQELTQLRDWLLPMLMNGQVKA